MPDLATVPHHPAMDEIVDVLCAKTQNLDRGFFQAEVAYFFGKMAATMRATIETEDRGSIPVNVYAMALANSGFGKGHSVNIIEEELLSGFRQRFMDDTLPVLSEQNLWVIANDRAARKGTDPQAEFEKAEKEYNNLGPYPFTFSDGTTAGVRDIRQKLLLANVGSINMQVDEIGLNLVGVTDLLTLYLELYDQGKVKMKLNKNTNENKRSEDIDGSTPTNMMLFGAPSKLLDNGQTETQFYSLLETGYARRCIFGFGKKTDATNNLSAEEVYDKLTQPTNSAAVSKWSRHFYKLADAANFGWKVTVNRDVAIALLEYRMNCEAQARKLPEHQDIQRSELEHRYSKALKLAGAYAFIDSSTEVLEEHLYSAIKLIEESGKQFQAIINRDKPYEKLAKFITTCATEQTHADIVTALPFYPKAAGPRNDMMNLATAWGYKNHRIIKKSFVDGIEFFKGETLQETNLDALTIGWSDNWAYEYRSDKGPFNQLHILTQAPGLHWANHHFKNGHRAEENVIAGFDMLVLDVDKGVTLQQAHKLMEDYKFLTYTTKRHQTTEADGTEHGDRFRMILPINYRLTMDSAEYKEFMNGIMAWLPFDCDESANQRAKKWETFEGGTFHYNLEGDTFDVLPFIPKTSRYEQHQKQNKELGSLDNLERWFAGRIGNGNRNNQMIKYALALCDYGWDHLSVRAQVIAFDKKLADPMGEDELNRTILQTVAKRFQDESKKAA